MNSYEISLAVARVLKIRKWSVRTCCDRYNVSSRKEIEEGVMKPLDKDFLQRIRSNNFKVVSPRVVHLCAFLDIDIDMNSEYQMEPLLLESEYLRLDNVLLINPELIPHVRLLINNVTTILGQEKVGK